MIRVAPGLVHHLGRLVERFRSDQRGQIAIIFGLISIVLVVGVGSGIDLSRAYLARQKLSEVAALTCQFSTRQSVIESANSTSNTTGGFGTYLSKVNGFVATSLTAQNWNTANPTDGLTGTGGQNYFTATQAVGLNTSSAGTAPTNPVTEISAVYPTTFLKIINVNQVVLHAKIGCQTASTTPQRDQNPVTEGFETGGGGYSFTLPSGATGTTTSPTTTFPASGGYTGSSGTKWTITGYCLEVDTAGVISATTPEGTHSAELDCDNGSGNAGNSAISTKVPLQVGIYELRYNYRSRVQYPNYDPTYVCASTTDDLKWANDTGNGFNGTRTNQINVYLDINTSSNTAPQHTTIDNTQQLAGFNLIDMCVYSLTWVERSVKIKITTPADYWLSFAADGNNDSYGGQLDNIRLCVDTCTGTLQNNFPTSWRAASNLGVTLFEDTFDLPVYLQDYPYHNISKGGNLNSSVGTSGALSGWPNQSATGWATAPFNQVNYGTFGGYQSVQHIMLDGYNAAPNNADVRRNRLVSRSFLLDPGYYKIEYYYLSMVSFTSPPVTSSCVSAPSASGQLFPTYSNYDGTIRYYNPINTNFNTNLGALFMASGLLVSTPIGGGALGSTTSYNNPDGTISTTPVVPPDAVNWQNYVPTAVNPVLDACLYVDNWQWLPRSVSVKITKPGFYWLSFSANGSTADGNGAAIDDVKLTALGSPSMANPPTSAIVTIPVPAPQPDTLYNNSGAFTGFSIIADPFVPPAVNQ